MLGAQQKPSVHDGRRAKGTCRQVEQDGEGDGGSLRTKGFDVKNNILSSVNNECQVREKKQKLSDNERDLERRQNESTTRLQQLKKELEVGNQYL